MNNEIYNNNEEVFDEKLNVKEEIINKRNQSIRYNNKYKLNNNLYSYLLLIMGMILLFIISFSLMFEFSLIAIIHYFLTVILLFISFTLTNQEKDCGYIVALVSSVFMILMIYERDFISSIIGVYIFVCSFKYLIKK